MKHPDLFIPEQRKSSHFTGSVRIVGGPYATFTEQMKDKASPTYKYLSETFQIQVRATNVVLCMCDANAHDRWRLTRLVCSSHDRGRYTFSVIMYLKMLSDMVESLPKDRSSFGIIVYDRW